MANSGIESQYPRRTVVMQDLCGLRSCMAVYLKDYPTEYFIWFVRHSLEEVYNLCDDYTHWRPWSTDPGYLRWYNYLHRQLEHYHTEPLRLFSSFIKRIRVTEGPNTFVRVQTTYEGVYIYYEDLVSGY